jgi:hypothetical protein
MFKELMESVENVMFVRDCDFLNGLTHVIVNRHEYSKEVQIQLDQFMDVGQQFFAPVN